MRSDERHDESLPVRKPALMSCRAASGESEEEERVMEAGSLSSSSRNLPVSVSGTFEDTTARVANI